MQFHYQFLCCQIRSFNPHYLSAHSSDSHTNCLFYCSAGHTSPLLLFLSCHHVSCLCPCSSGPHSFSSPFFVSNTSCFFPSSSWLMLPAVPLFCTSGLPSVALPVDFSWLPPSWLLGVSTSPLPLSLPFFPPIKANYSLYNYEIWVIFTQKISDFVNF
jgi:hypothetical protein